MTIIVKIKEIKRSETPEGISKIRIKIEKG
jgi:hypothetical protein